MANIFNADDGAISGSAGIKLSSDTSGVLNIQTNGTTAISISSSQVVSFPATSGFSFAGQVTFAAGTAAAPSISVTGDTNTGIYFPAADTIAFTEGGVESARFNSSGDFGVGETSPDSRLEVAKAITFTNIDTFPQLCIKPATGSAGNRLNLAVDNSSNVAFIQAVNRGVGDIPLVLQRYAGNVGIGTTSPRAVSGYSSMGINGTTGGLFDIFANGTRVATFGADTTVSLASITNIALTFGTNNTERARITAAGEFLVGVTSIATGFSTFAQIEASGTTGGVLINSSANQIGRLMFTNGNTSGNEGLIRYDGSNSSMQFWTAATERARITSAGDVGIGTTSPATKLDVRGIVYTDNQYRVGTNSAGANTGIIKWNAGNSLGIYTWGDALNIEIGGSNVIFKPEGGSERARITSGGNLLVGMTTTPSISVSNSIGHKGAANGIAGSANMSGSTWVNLVTLPTPSIAGARVNILGNENGNVNTYYGTWIIAYSSSGWGITGPFNENQRGNDYGVPNLRISGSNIQVQARNGVSSGIIYYNIEYFSV